MAKFWEGLLSFWPLIVAFGPGLFLFLRFQIKGVQPSREAYIATIALAYLLLLMKIVALSEIRRDHRVICKQVEDRLWKEDPERMEGGDGLPDECYRYTPEYADLAAEMNSGE